MADAQLTYAEEVGPREATKSEAASETEDSLATRIDVLEMSINGIAAFTGPFAILNLLFTFCARIHLFGLDSASAGVASMFLGLSCTLLLARPGNRWFFFDRNGVWTGPFRGFRGRWSELKLIGGEHGTWRLENAAGKSWCVPSAGAAAIWRALLANLSADQIKAGGELRRPYFNYVHRRTERVQQPSLAIRSAVWSFACLAMSALLFADCVDHRSPAAVATSLILLAAFLGFAADRAKPLWRRLRTETIHLSEEGITLEHDGVDTHVDWERVRLFSCTGGSGTSSFVIADDANVIQFESRIGDRSGDITLAMLRGQRVQTNCLKEEILRGVSKSKVADMIVAMPKEPPK